MQSPVSLQHSCIAAKHIVSLCTSKLETLKSKVAQGNKKFVVQKRNSVSGGKKRLKKPKNLLLQIPQKIFSSKNVDQSTKQPSLLQTTQNVTFLYAFILKYLQNQAKNQLSCNRSDW